MSELSRKRIREVTEESRTPPRYSLAYDKIGSQDIRLNHVSGPIRLVMYEHGDKRQVVVQRILQKKGLIAGVPLEAARAKEQVYRIPTSARPIAYDARVDTAGTYSYNDQQLFFDLGSLLGTLYTATKDPLVVVGDLGKSMTFVEFTQPSERQLYFVPGIEKIVKAAGSDIEPVEYYLERLSEAFDYRFDDRSPYFRQGFSNAVTTEVA